MEYNTIIQKIKVIKSSINKTYCKKMGITIKGEMKIINYKYDVTSFIRNIDNQSTHSIY
jgi:hypothetical protein